MKHIYDEGEILEYVNELLESLNKTIDVILSVLQENKFILNEDEIPDIQISETDSLKLKKHSLKIEETLLTLENQINVLKKYGDTNNELVKIKSHLNKLLNTTQTISDDSDSEQHIPHRIVSRNVSGNRSSIYGKGLSLDVLRGPSPVDTTINLNRKVEFIKIDSNDEEDDDDLSDTNEYISSNDECDNEDETIIQCKVHHNPPDFKVRQNSVHYQSMKQLSDEQLQKQLQDKIFQFSAENKKSRENLRAEKSFELLKRCQTNQNDLQHKHSIDREHMCLSEEGIAVLYNISEQLE